MKTYFLNLIKRTGYKIIPKEWSVLADSTTVLKNIFKKEEKLLIFDVGAHEGTKANLYSQIFKNDIEIYSFEPFPESFKILEKKNLKGLKHIILGFLIKNLKILSFVMQEVQPTLCLNYLIKLILHGKEING